jgi:hypothetical protein
MEQTLKTRQGKFIFRPYEDQDESAICQLWEVAFGHPIPSEIWRWKFHDNPFGRLMMVCFTDSGQPVALYAGIPYVANHQGKTIRIVQLIDNMSHPAFRFAVNGRKGLFGLTVDNFISQLCMPQHISFSYGFGGDRHFRLGKLLFNYRRPGEGIVYLQGHIDKIQLSTPFLHRKARCMGQFSPVFDELNRKLNKYYPLAVCRDNRFIHWRYFLHPQQQYLVFTGMSLFGTHGSLIVLTVNKEMATIVDILVPDSAGEISALLFDVSQMLKQSGVFMLQTWLPAGHFIARHLVSMGFEMLPEPIGFIPTTIYYDHTINKDQADKNLFYTMGDGDLF